MNHNKFLNLMNGQIVFQQQNVNVIKHHKVFYFFINLTINIIIQFIIVQNLNKMF